VLCSVFRKKAFSRRGNESVPNVGEDLCGLVRMGVRNYPNTKLVCTAFEAYGDHFECFEPLGCAEQGVYIVPSQISRRATSQEQKLIRTLSPATPHQPQILGPPDSLNRTFRYLYVLGSFSGGLLHRKSSSATILCFFLFHQKFFSSLFLSFRTLVQLWQSTISRSRPMRSFRGFHKWASA
jgi:hypothetical protein